MRRWRAILLCLLAGAVVNVLVAWGCTLWAPARVRGRPQAAWTEGRSSGPWPSGWEKPRLSRIWDGPGYTGYHANWVLYVFADGSGASTRLAHPSGNRARTAVIVGISGGNAGWPMRALRWHEKVPDGSLRAFPKLEFPPLADRPALLDLRARAARWGIQRERRLPIRPIARGFACNTVLSAALLWAPMFGVGPLRRWRLRRRGRCLRCAHDLTGIADACPECGTPREPAP